MAASDMQGKKPKGDATEVYSRIAKVPATGQQADSKSSANLAHISHERAGSNSYQGGSFAYERNKLGHRAEGSAKEALKGGAINVVDSLGSGSTNQHSGLYIGGGKMGGPTIGSQSSTVTGKSDSVEWSPQVIHVRSNSAGSLKISKSLGGTFWASGNGNGGYAETMSSSGSSNGGSPGQDLGKGIKAYHENSNKVRGIGNIGGRGGVLNPKSSPSSGQALSAPRHSGEFSIPSHGNLIGNCTSNNRGTAAARHSGEFSVSGNGPVSSSSSSSPHTSGELGSSSKNSMTLFSKNSADPSNSNSKGCPVLGEGNSSSAGSSNAAKGGKSLTCSPPRSSTGNLPNLGNLCRAGRNKSNERIDCAMGNILNPNHIPPCTNGNIFSSGYGNNSKGSSKSDATKSGNNTARVGNADPISGPAMVKRGLCSTDAEEVKNIGNELYRKGNFAEALTLYDRAVGLSPGQASYRSNKAAALSGLGRLAEAVHECKEAVKLDPQHTRAHQRAASLYLRLGLVESSKRHFQSAGLQCSSQDLQRVEQVKKHISKCIEMRKAANWMVVVKEIDAAVVAGADSAPQVFGYKAEALLKLHKLEEADSVLCNAQKTEEALTGLGIIPADSFIYIVRAHIDMALGRFEEAIMAAQTAVRIDPRKVEASETLRRARAVCVARSSGNELFKMGKFFEACAAYGEGLESDPMNAVLLCNRAACRSKLGQWEKAVEDCSAALDVQSNYTKALMRRADCNAKLERWEDALNDYQNLIKEMPGDVDVARGVVEAQVALKKSQGEDMYKMKFGRGMEEVSTKDQYREALTFPGLVVVEFIARWNDRCREISPFVESLCKRYPAVYFIKVDVEESPYLAKTECVSSVPAFKLFKNGTKMKEMLEPSQQALEYAVQQLSM